MGMPASTFESLINGNSHFIFELAKRLKTIGFTYTATACFFTLRFFARNSMFEYDRYLICGGSIILAHKAFDIEFKVRNLIVEFDGLVALLEKKTSSLTH
jgi:hypothetical protein